MRNICLIESIIAFDNNSAVKIMKRFARALPRYLYIRARLPAEHESQEIQLIEFARLARCCPVLISTLRRLSSKDVLCFSAPPANGFSFAPSNVVATSAPSPLVPQTRETSQISSMFNTVQQTKPLTNGSPFPDFAPKATPAQPTTIKRILDDVHRAFAEFSRSLFSCDESTASRQTCRQ